MDVSSFSYKLSIICVINIAFFEYILQNDIFYSLFALLVYKYPNTYWLHHGQKIFIKNLPWLYETLINWSFSYVPLEFG